MADQPLTAEDKIRFWAKVDKREPDECWPWKACKVAYGRGMFRVSKKPPIVRHAPQIALVIRLGRWLRPGFCSLHHCDNPNCCNPAHLYEGTNADNVADRTKRRRWRVQS